MKKLLSLIMLLMALLVTGCFDDDDDDKIVSLTINAPKVKVVMNESITLDAVAFTKMGISKQELNG